VTGSLRVALCAVLALGLSACVSLFPKAQEAQLYSFTAAAPPAGAAADLARVFDVERLPTTFAREADGSQILTIDGDQAAYIAAARWDAPASQLFDEAETAAFDSSSGPARLLGAGDVAAATVSLRLDVRTFEARYLAGPKVAPTVFVTVHALLVGTVDRKVIAEEVFESQQAAADNRVGPIVDAFGAATSDVLAHIVDWTGREGAAAKAS